MRHYSSEQWIDFARDVVREREKIEMQRHLKSGCKECWKELGMWQRLHKFALREPAYTPSEGAVRIMNAAFASGPVQRSRRNAKEEVASLLFDSFRSPLLAGVRSTASTSQQLLYGAGNYRIDVRIEPQMDSEKVVLIGQVLNSADPDELLAALPVSVLQGRRMLAESLTSEYGEFQIECGLQESFHISVLLPGGKAVTLHLVEPTGDASKLSGQVIGNNKVRKFAKVKKKGTSTFV
jgi:hypothetical protein